MHEVSKISAAPYQHTANLSTNPAIGRGPTKHVGSLHAVSGSSADICPYLHTNSMDNMTKDLERLSMQAPTKLSRFC